MSSVTEMNRKPLKPCPFCGSEAVHVKSNDGIMMVLVCPDCQSMFEVYSTLTYNNRPNEKGTTEK